MPDEWPRHTRPDVIDITGSSNGSKRVRHINSELMGLSILAVLKARATLVTEVRQIFDG